MITRYKTLPGALTTLFPELDSNSVRTPNPSTHHRLNNSWTDIHLGKYWNDAVNRKRYFDSIAKRGKFNPLSAENWYSIPLKTYVQHKVDHIYKSIAMLLTIAGIQINTRLLQWINCGGAEAMLPQHRH